MFTKIQTAIYKTLIYADLFHFPLADKEIHQYLIWEEKTKPPAFKMVQNTLSQLKIPNKNGYYYLFDKEIVIQRLNKANPSRKKKQIAQKICKILSKIPMVKFIGISGNLAMDNAGEKDDIDLFIIAQKNTLWLTRLLTTLLLDLKKLRRRPSTLNFQDKICLNLFLDEGNLTLPSNKQNLYTAHEICQLKPIYNKENTYQKFLLANSWIQKYLPNSYTQKKLNHFNHIAIKSRLAGKLYIHLLNIILFILNYFIMLPQLLYMRSRRTKEIIDKNIIFFHPQDNSGIILKKFNKSRRQKIARLC